MPPGMTVALIPCPECGFPVIPTGHPVDGEPEYLTGICAACGGTVEMKRDEITDKLTARVVRPS